MEFHIKIADKVAFIDIGLIFEVELAIFLDAGRAIQSLQISVVHHISQVPF